MDTGMNKLREKWGSGLGILVGVIRLFAVFFVPILLCWAWILVTGALLTWRRPVVTARCSHA
jgi:hypothetical protein